MHHVKYVILSCLLCGHGTVHGTSAKLQSRSWIGFGRIEIFSTRWEDESTGVHFALLHTQVYAM